MLTATRPSCFLSSDDYVIRGEACLTVPRRSVKHPVLLTLLAILAILIIAAITVPNVLRTDQGGWNQPSAIGSLRAINSGEATYSSNCAGGGYAVALEDLAKPPTTGGAAFIPADLGKNGIVKSGYRFRLTKNLASGMDDDIGSPATTCNGSTDAPSRGYFATAEPVTPGSTERFFATDQRGFLYESHGAITNPIDLSRGATPLQ